MAHKVIWSARALADLQSIAAFIEQQSPSYASTVATRIVAATDRLADFPNMGRRLPEFDRDDLRDVIVYSYRIIYRVSPDAVHLGAIVHGARLLLNVLSERDLS